MLHSQEKKKTAKAVEKVTSTVEKSTLGDLESLVALKEQMEETAKEAAKKKLAKKAADKVVDATDVAEKTEE